MFGIFNLDSPIGRAMNTVADVMILSVLWLVCSLPIFTAGAATTALYYASIRSVRQEGSVFKDFFRAFRDNFRQSLGATALFGAVALIVIGDFWVLSRVSIAGGNGLRIVLYAVIFLTVMTAGYFFPLLARFEGTIKQHLKNSFLLAMSYPVVTVVMTALNGAPILLFLYNPQWFFRVLPVFTILWTGGAAHINARLLLKIFEKTHKK